MHHLPTLKAEFSLDSIADIVGATETAGKLHRPTTMTEVKHALNVLTYEGRGGIIVLDDYPVDVPLGSYLYGRGAGPELDERIILVDFFGHERTHDSAVTDYLLFSGDTGFLQVAGLHVRGNHREDGREALLAGNRSGLNKAGVGFSQGKWSQRSDGSWYESGRYDGALVVVSECYIENFGTGILGYATGEYVTYHNTVQGGAEWGQHGLSGISFVTYNGDPTRMPASLRTLVHPDTQAPVCYIHAYDDVRDVAQAVDSIFIGVDKPSDGNGIISANSPHATGAILFEECIVSDNTGAGLNSYEPPTGGVWVLGGEVRGNWRHADELTTDALRSLNGGVAPYHPERSAHWGGQVLVQSAYTRILRVEGVEFTAGFAPNVQTAGIGREDQPVTIVEVEGPAPQPEPEPEETVDIDIEELAEIVASKVRVELTQTLYPLLVEILEEVGTARDDIISVKSIMAQIRGHFS